MGTSPADLTQTATQPVLQNVASQPTQGTQDMLTPVVVRPVESTLEVYEHGTQKAASATPEKQTEEKGEPTITLTQSQLDAIVRDRLSRQRARLEKKLSTQVVGDQQEPHNVDEVKTVAAAKNGEVKTDLDNEQNDLVTQLAQMQEKLDRLTFEQLVVTEANTLGLDVEMAKRLVRMEDVDDVTKDAVVKQLTSLISTFPALRRQPPLTAPSSAGGAPQRDLQREYFGGGGGGFWTGGGVLINSGE